MDEILIQERAEILFEFFEEKFNYGYDYDNPDMLDSYKACFALKSRSVKQYVRAFKDSCLTFDIGSVEAVYEEFCDMLPGYQGLASQEREILHELLDTINGGRVGSLFNFKCSH